jgi:O-6-methylguanine DNA methyltransferase
MTVALRTNIPAARATSSGSKCKRWASRRAIFSKFPRNAGASLAGVTSEYGYTLFDTPIGRCGIVWSELGVALLALPEGRELATRARISKLFPDASPSSPPPPVERAIAGIEALLRGQPSNLSGIELDMRAVPPFHQRVYDAAREIAPGETLSYGELAARLGSPGSARAVGQALGRNPFAIIVPCHRVLAANGRVGGFSANGGITTKLRLLTCEAPALSGEATAHGGFGFDPEVAVRELREADPTLAKLIQRVGPFRMQLQRTPSVFGALAEAIVFQQLNGKAAATIFARLCALFPHAGGLTPERIIKASDDKLRSAGLSGSKLLSLRDLAVKTRSGELPTLDDVQTMSDQEIIERLTTVRGIGQWTVEMLLMFRLGRPDVLPVDDFGVRKGFGIAFDRVEPSKSNVAQRGERWRPYRTVASWYLWRATDSL